MSDDTMMPPADMPAEETMPAEEAPAMEEMPAEAPAEEAAA